jgi:hypothetical protein
MGLRPTQGEITPCRKTFPRKVRGTADPSAALGMTKGRAELDLDQMLIKKTAGMKNR